MNNTLYTILVLIVMFVVTFIPRAIPITFVTKKIKSTFVKSFLYYVPYAVLSALTIPSIFNCCGNIYIAIAGTACAILLSFLNQKLYIVSLASVILVYVLLLIFV